MLLCPCGRRGGDWWPNHVAHARVRIKAGWHPEGQRRVVAAPELEASPQGARSPLAALLEVDGEGAQVVVGIEPSVGNREGPRGLRTSPRVALGLVLRDVHPRASSCRESLDRSDPPGVRLLPPDQKHRAKCPPRHQVRTRRTPPDRYSCAQRFASRVVCSSSWCPDRRGRPGRIPVGIWCYRRTRSPPISLRVRRRRSPGRAALLTARRALAVGTGPRLHMCRRRRAADLNSHHGGSRSPPRSCHPHSGCRSRRLVPP